MISSTRLARRQLLHQPVRLAVALAGVAFAVILMTMQLGFQDALYRSAVILHERLRADLVLINPAYNVLGFPTRFPRRRLYQALAHPAVTDVTSVLTGLARWKHPHTGLTRDIIVFGVDPVAAPLALPGVDAGLHLLRYPDVVLYDERSRPEHGPVGELVRAHGGLATEVDGRRVTVRGLYQMGTSFGIDASIVTSELNLRRIVPTYPRGATSIGLVRLRPGSDPAAVRHALAGMLDDDVVVLSVPEFMAREIAYWATATPIGYIFAFGVVMGCLVGAIIVYQILFAGISDHLAEYATLKAMGYRDGFLARVVLIEATLLACGGFVPGIAAAAGLHTLTAEATNLPMRLAPDRAAQVLALTVAMCWASGIVALRKLRTADPAEVF